MILYSKMRGAAVWTSVTIIVSGILLTNTRVYFDGGPIPRFLIEKGEIAREPLWLAALYLHIIGAAICLVAGGPLMFPSWTTRYSRWHRFLGYVYVNAVLWLAAPTGLLLAPFAKGGIGGTLGFLLLGGLSWITTWMGYRAILRRDMETHVQQMIRSYSLALTAPSFRVLQAVLFFLQVGDDTNYVVSLWLSIAASVWLAESYRYRCGRGLAARATVPSTLVTGDAE